MMASKIISAQLLRQCLVKPSFHVTARSTSCSTTEQGQGGIRFEPKPIDPAALAALRKEFDKHPKYKLGQNIGVNYKLTDLAFRHSTECSAKYDFDITVPMKKPKSYDKKGDFNWIVQALSIMRAPFNKYYDLPEDFEFSSNYIAFWHKIETAYIWLQNILVLIKNGKDMNDRLFRYHIMYPMRENGQWSWIANIVNKYGVVPLQCYPGTVKYNKNVANVMLLQKLCEMAQKLKELVKAGASDHKLQKTIMKQTKLIYDIVSTFMGTPPEKITFYNPKHSTEGGNNIETTPLEFYDNFVRPVYDVSNKLFIANDPRNKTYKLFKVQSLGNMVPQDSVEFINVPSDVTLELITNSLKGGEAVLLSYDRASLGLNDGKCYDLDLYDYPLVLDFDIGNMMNKNARFVYGMAIINHDLVINAAHNHYPKPDAPQPLMFGMYDEIKITVPWVEQNVYALVVDKKFVPRKILDILNQRPKSLPPWDIMTLQNSFSSM